MSSSALNPSTLTSNQGSGLLQIQWSTLNVLSNESTSPSYNPSIVFDGEDNLYTVWEDTTDYNGEGTDSDIFYKKYNTTTQSWGNTVLISTDSTLNS